MDNIPLNSAAFILSWYQQNVDARASCARFAMDPDGKPSDRIIIMYDCGCRIRRWISTSFGAA
jgi:hypothetical protein